MLFAKKKSSSFNILKSPIWLVIGIVILGLVLSAFIRITLQKAAIQRQIDDLKAEKEKLESNNNDLAGLLDYFASESYKEREMRQKLGMQKPGEHVVIISRPDEQTSQGVSPDSGSGSSGLSNIKKWWNYFFGK